MDTLKVFSPYDGSFIKEVPLDDERSGEEKLALAYEFFNDRKNCLPKHIRIEILEKAAKIMSGRVEELTKIAAEEGGKPLKDSRIEVMRAINGVKLAVEHIGHIQGKEVQMGQIISSENRLAFTTREPIGVGGIPYSMHEMTREKLTVIKSKSI